MAALEKILQQVKEGTLSIEEASLSLHQGTLCRFGLCPEVVDTCEASEKVQVIWSRKNRRAD